MKNTLIPGPKLKYARVPINTKRELLKHVFIEHMSVR
jgi:hypothetical protein